MSNQCTVNFKLIIKKKKRKEKKCPRHKAALITQHRHKDAGDRESGLFLPGAGHWTNPHLA